MKMLKCKIANQRGIALLEYAAGAAIVLTVIVVALSAMSTNVGTMFTAIGEWALGRAQDINR